jgi:hypothetical protein
VKIRAALSLAVAVVTATMAANSIASAEPLANPTVQGQVAAIVAFCTRIYPPGGETYLRLERQLFGTEGRPERRLEVSVEYRRAFAAAIVEFGKIPLSQARQACEAAAKVTLGAASPESADARHDASAGPQSHRANAGH